MNLLQMTRAKVREYLIDIQNIEGEESVLLDMDLFTLYKLFLEREKQVCAVLNKMKFDLMKTHKITQFLEKARHSCRLS